MKDFNMFCTASQTAKKGLYEHIFTACRPAADEGLEPVLPFAGHAGRELVLSPDGQEDYEGF